ncbi:MAG: prepilin-type N-terminal cleavage/methylation domain-containing protein [Candidatus Eisenbacteria bacterium]
MRLQPDPRGFTLIELLIVITVMGLLIAMSIPSYSRISRSYQVKGAAENIAAEVKLMRSKAMATGRSMTIHFAMDSTNAGDYHVHDTGRITKWDLPRGISYASGSAAGFTITRDGRVNTSSYIILQNDLGKKDTVSVQLSGLVLTP